MKNNFFGCELISFFHDFYIKHCNIKSFSVRQRQSKKEITRTKNIAIEDIRKMHFHNKGLLLVLVKILKGTYCSFLVYIEPFESRVSKKAIISTALLTQSLIHVLNY